MRAWIILSFLSTAAAADPAVVRVGRVAGGTVASADATLRPLGDGVHARLTLVLATRSRTATEVGLQLALPPGVRATGLALNGSAGEQYFPGDGRDRYEGRVAALKDPALLEQVSPGVLALRVYPVERDAPQTVTIEVALPADASLVLARPGAAKKTFVATAESRWDTMFAGQVTADTPVVDRDAPCHTVDAEMSLVALPEEPHWHGWSRESVYAASRGWREHVQTVPGAPDAKPGDDVVAYNP